MPRSLCCEKVELKRGQWSPKEDELLKEYIRQHGEGQWKRVPKQAGLLRCGKSCRLRWMNYLRPGIKRGNISEAEEGLIILLHRLLKNRWSLIAGRLPGRTDNEIKNYWNTHIVKKLNNNNNNSPLEKPKKYAPVVGESSKKEKKKPKKNVATVVEKTEVEKIKVYKPKAIRLSPTFGTLNSRWTTGRDAAEMKVAATECPPMTTGRDTVALESNTCPPIKWPSLSDLGFLQPDDGVLNWDHIPATPETFHGDINELDIVYDEFFQLI